MAPAGKLELKDWLDDLSVRFIINLPQEELATPGRLGFQIEEAHWYYEDFIRPLDPSLPSLNPRIFCRLIFQHCPLLAAYSGLSEAAYDDFIQYKTRVPVRGAILLDQQLNNVVLVKGWKKGAKWSFPRGKINKDEKDLDCAVREVYEETGFDVREAGLIPEDEESVKHIDVSLREQQMRLYVFRGVPLDTHFEPKTRKEISKVEWYKLSDLPTVKKEKQLHEQVATGQDGAMKGSQFYMVAPFLGSLRKWINEQRRADKAKLRAAHPRGLVIEDEDTEAEANGRTDDLGMSDVPPEGAPAAEEDNHMARLLAGLHSSKQASSVASVPPEAVVPRKDAADAAAELKRLLSVGATPQPAAQQEEPNPLLALLRGPSSNSVGQEKMSVPPQTPIENIITNPPIAQTPAHRHPRPPPFTSLPPPPDFNLPPNHTTQPDYTNLPSGPQRDFSDSIGQLSSSMLPPHEWQLHQGGKGMPYAPNRSSNMPDHTVQNFQSHQRPIDFMASARPLPQFHAVHAATVPQAGSLPPPKLTYQSLAMLNALKSPNEQPARKAPFEQRGLIPSTVLPARKKQTTAQEPLTSPSSLPSADSNAQERQELPTTLPPTPAETQAPVIQPSTGKPRTAHQDALLNLFRSSPTPQQSMGPKFQGMLSPQEPVELSAHHSPHASRSSFMPPPKPTHQQLPALATNVARPGSPGLTSATVSGPLNAPDFDTVKRRQRISPTSATTAVPPTGGLVPVEMGDGIPTPMEIQAPRPKSFQPQILKRPPQGPGSMSSSAAASPPIQGMDFEHVTTSPQQLPTAADPKAALLSLFTAPAGAKGKAVTPVSPLPDVAAGVQSQNSSKRPSVTGVGSVDDDLMLNRSRISSLASIAGNEDGQSRQVSLTGLGPTQASEIRDDMPSMSPTGMNVTNNNKDFLLGFLHGVAKSAEGIRR